MGKNRDKQRTKGNLKPSSSGRAAALVTRDGALGFVGFSGQGSANLGYVPMTTSLGDEVDSSVDSDFRMIMRKLSKRDSLTKYKALQEFSELCKNSKSDVVEGVLPFWPRLYNKLAMDIDHRVREGTQEAMLQLVKRVGRNLAPHLKSLMGVWLCAQFDSYATVASAAQHAFQAAFSEAKQQEALMFCRVGLCEYLEDNILRQTAETLSDTKVISKEDRDSKYHRVVASSVLALGYLISVSSTEINSEMKERYQEMFEEKKLWKLARHASPLIRSAIFSMVINSCLKIPSVVQSVSSQVCPVVLSSLDESEPAVCHNLWGAVLFVLRTIPNCWEQVNVRKAVLPKLWSVLRNGGYGCASVIYPSLLPFLSKIPQQVIGQGVGFYREFFDNLQVGIKDPKVLSSPSESAVVMTTYMECLQYCLLHPVTQNGSVMSIREYLIKDQLLPMIKVSLEPWTKLPTMPLYIALSNLLNYLSTTNTKKTITLETIAMETVTTETEEVPFENIRTESKDKCTNEERLVLEADIILRWFWEGFSSLLLSILQHPNEELDVAMVDCMTHCLICIKSPSLLSKRQKKSKVAFCNPSTESIKEPSQAEPENKPAITSYAKIEDLYDGHLLKLVMEICSFCQEKMKNKSQTSIYLRILSTLFPHFVSIKLLQVLLDKADIDSTDLNKLCEEFLSVVVYPLFMDCGEHEQDNTHVISLLFGVLYLFSSEEQVHHLNKVIEANNSTDFLCTLLQQGMQESLPGLSDWLKSHSGSERIQKLLRVASLEDQDNSSLWEVLHLCLCSDKKGPLVSKPCVDIILESFVEMFRRKNIVGLGRIIKILQDYFEWCQNQTDDLSSAMEDILLALFLMQFSHPLIQDEVLVCWHAGIQAFSSQYFTCRCDVLLVRTSAIITERLKSADTVDSILSLTGAAVRLLQDTSNLENQQGDNMTSTRKLYHSFTPDVKKCTEWRDQSLKGCWLSSFLCANLPVISDTPDIKDVQDMIDIHHKSVLFAALVTKSLLTVSDGLLNKEVVVEGHMLVKMYLEACWVNAWCLCVLGSKDRIKNKLPSHFTQALPNIHKLLEIISLTLQDLMEFLEKNELSQALLDEALMMAKTNGFLWTLVLDTIMLQLKNKEFTVDHSVMLTTLQESLCIGKPSFAESIEKQEAVLQSIVTGVSYINNIYDMKVLTENNNKLLGQELQTQEFACVFSILATCLEKWSQLTDREEAAMMEYQLTLVEVLDGVLEWKNSNDRTLVLNANMEDTTMAEVTVNTAIMRIIKLVITDAAKLISSSLWDFILCGLAGWLQTCEENLLSVSTSLSSTTLCCQACSLYATVSAFFETFPEKPSTEETKDEAEETNTSDNADDITPTGEYPPNLLTEWKEFFSVNVYNTVLSMFISMGDKCRESNFHVTMPIFRTCESLGKAVINTPVNILQEYQYKRPGDSSDGDDILPKWAKDLLCCLLPLLECDVHSIQIATYKLLSQIMPILPSCNTKHDASSQEQDEIERSPPSQLMSTLNTSLSQMKTIMEDASVPFGGQLCLATDIEARQISLTLFLSCRLLILFFKSTNFENRSEYAVFLRKNKLVDSLMSVLYCLMPQDSKTVVTDDMELSVEDCVTESLVQDLSRCVYYSLLHWMPAMVRQWFNGLEKKHATVVDKYTTLSVTPSLCQHEMQQVKNSSVQFTNMQVKTRPVAGEVAAVYTIDEISMELVVKLANNHPLGVVTVDSGKKVGVTNSQWRSWILQMTTFLTHQNGSIMDGLILWKHNADKHFEGVDDCMICFSVIHVSNYSLPKLSCKTCKKKFHSICLYRWFNTSNNSTCPLCRNIF